MLMTDQSFEKSYWPVHIRVRMISENFILFRQQCNRFLRKFRSFLFRQRAFNGEVAQEIHKLCSFTTKCWQFRPHTPHHVREIVLLRSLWISKYKITLDKIGLVDSSISSKLFSLQIQCYDRRKPKPQFILDGSISSKLFSKEIQCYDRRKPKLN